MSHAKAAQVASEFMASPPNPAASLYERSTDPAWRVPRPLLMSAIHMGCLVRNAMTSFTGNVAY